MLLLGEGDFGVPFPKEHGHGLTSSYHIIKTVTSKLHRLFLVPIFACPFLLEGDNLGATIIDFE